MQQSRIPQLSGVRPTGSRVRESRTDVRSMSQLSSQYQSVPGSVTSSLLSTSLPVMSLKFGLAAQQKITGPHTQPGPSAGSPPHPKNP